MPALIIVESCCVCIHAGLCAFSIASEAKLLVFPRLFVLPASLLCRRWSIKSFVTPSQSNAEIPLRRTPMIVYLCNERKTNRPLCVRRLLPRLTSGPVRALLTWCGFAIMYNVSLKPKMKRKEKKRKENPK
ncbi:hypothetical protein LX32DRAFT_324171 [Colletotrichum zoysiae]|uniref:Uncharacterized protein n=1 Tax=Colletotrichum zoysiae TaxID=1216348 RepID=A0AAD9M676_9PEZI|nr:hypothetical protein LX32DRAFT_324171 [Colletotrichum zoysiae]